MKKKKEDPEPDILTCFDEQRRKRAREGDRKRERATVFFVTYDKNSLILIESMLCISDCMWLTDWLPACLLCEHSMHSINLHKKWWSPVYFSIPSAQSFFSLYLFRIFACFSSFSQLFVVFALSRSPFIALFSLFCSHFGTARHKYTHEIPAWWRYQRRKQIRKKT